MTFRDKGQALEPAVLGLEKQGSGRHRRQSNETNDAKRIAGYSDFNKLAVEKGWVISLLQPVQTLAYKSNLDFTPYLTGWLAVNTIKWK